MSRKWSNEVAVYFGGYDPGTHTTRAAVNLEVEALDPTSFGDAAERALAGLRVDTFEWAGWFDDGSDSMDAAAAALLGSGTNNVVSVFFGTGTGDVAYAGTGVLLAHRSPASIRELVRMEAEFKPDQVWDRGVHYGPKRSVGSGTVTGSVDNGAASTAGGVWYLQVFGVSATGSAILQHSVDSTTWTDKQAQTITARAALKIAISGTISRYTRVTMATSTGTLGAVLVRS